MISAVSTLGGLFLCVALIIVVVIFATWLDD